MPVVQLDWVKLIEKFGDVTGLYFLTHRQASLLMSLTEQLTWKKTFRAFDYDFEDYDTVQSEVADLQRYLAMPVNLVDLVGYIDEIEELLIALQSTANCCDGNTDISDGDYYTDEVVDGVGDVPQNIIDAGYATGSSDWAGFDDYKCMVSHVIIDSMESKLRMLAPYVDSAGVIIGGIATITSIVTVILSGGLSVLALGLIAATGSTALLYKLITSGSILLSIADDVSDDHDELACAVYNGDGSADSLAELDAKIDELYDVPVTTILQNLNLGPELKALYGGRHNEQDIAELLEAAGYDTGDFTCDCEEAADFIEEWFFPSPLPDDPWISSTTLWNATCSGSIQMTATNQEMYVSTGVLRLYVGESESGYVDIKKINFTWRKSTDDTNYWMKVFHDGGTYTKSFTQAKLICQDEEIVFDPPLRMTSGRVIEFGGAASAHQLLVGYVKLEFDAEA